MPRPRPVFAGDVIHIQRRVRDGRFFLVPKAELLDLVTYAYGLAAEKYGLELHALCVMSNHLHVVATDVDGRHPEFTAWAHRVIALGLKRMHGIEGAVWQEGGASVQRLVGSVAAIEALAYVRVNPVAAGCVRHEGSYPGVFGADEEVNFTPPGGQVDYAAIAAS
jgi:putative transposase